MVRPNEIINKDRITRKIYLLYIIIGLLFVSSVFFFILWRKNHNILDEITNPYPLIDFSRSYVNQEHFISTLQPLREELDAFVEKKIAEGYEISLYMEFFNTGANISINNEQRIFPASLMKMPVAMAAMKKIENGIWLPDDELVLFPDDVDEKSGYLYEEGIGSKFSITFLIEKSLKESDNTAYKMLLRNLEKEELNGLLENLGLEDFFNEIGQINAKEYSRLFRSLYTATYLNRDNSEQLLVWLSQSGFNDFLSQGLPSDILFSHKYGQNNASRLFSDSGIVYVPNRPYLLTVLIHPSNPETVDQDFIEAKKIMKEISSMAYTYINEN